MLALKMQKDLSEIAGWFNQESLLQRSCWAYKESDYSFFSYEISISH